MRERLERASAEKLGNEDRSEAEQELLAGRSIRESNAPDPIARSRRQRRILECTAAANFNRNRHVRSDAAGAGEGLHNSTDRIHDLNRRGSNERRIRARRDAVAADDEDAIGQARLRKSNIDRRLRSERETAALERSDILLNLVDRIRSLVSEIAKCRLLPHECAAMQRVMLSSASVAKFENRIGSAAKPNP